MDNSILFTHLRLWRGKQGLFGECIARSTANWNFRGFIERDSYDLQCKWTGELWTQSGWSYVMGLNPSESRLFQFSPYKSGDDWEDAAERDLSNIVQLSMDCFGEKPRKRTL